VRDIFNEMLSNKDFIIVITHLDRLKEYMNDQYYIEKKDGISRIVI
jgi:DNA repair exonuclease SbcCD ATPase subunit